MAEAIIKKDHLSFDGKSYFCVGAEDVQIGAYGLKRKDRFHFPRMKKGDHIEIHSIFDFKGLKPRQVVVCDIDYEKSSKFSFAGGGEVQVNGLPVSVKGDAKGAKHKLQQDKLKLMKLVLDIKEVSDQLNDDKDALIDLLKVGQDARVVHQIFVVLEATLASSFSGNGAVNIHAGTTVDSVKVGASGSGSASHDGKSQLTLDKGDVFSYSMLRLTDKMLKDFHHANAKETDPAKWKLPKLSPADLTEDQYGHG